jgi:hypothetical protein
MEEEPEAAIACVPLGVVTKKTIGHQKNLANNN